MQSLLAALMLAATLTSSLTAQPSPSPSDPAQQIEALLLAQGLRRPAPPPPQAAAAPTAAPTLATLDLRLRLETAAPAPASSLSTHAAAPFPSARLALLDRRELSAPLPRERSPEFHPSLLLAAAVGPHDELLSWRLVHDPRLLRAEFPTPTGELEGQTLPRPQPELLLSLPSHPSLREIRLYERIWPRPQLEIRLLAATPASGVLQ